VGTSGDAKTVLETGWDGDKPCGDKWRWGQALVDMSGDGTMLVGMLWDGTRVARSTRRKPDTLDLFPSYVREPKTEGLDLYTYVYVCVRFELKFSTG